MAGRKAGIGWRCLPAVLALAAMLAAGRAAAVPGNEGTVIALPDANGTIRENRAGADNAEGRPFSMGARLGMFFPMNGLTGHPDQRGASLVSSPGTGLVFRWADAPGTAWEWGADLVIFTSEEDAGLRMLFVPVQIRWLREVANADGLSLLVSAGGGAGFLSLNSGAERSDTMGLASVGAQLEHPIESLTAAFGFDVGIRFQGGDYGTMLQVRLTLSPRRFL